MKTLLKACLAASASLAILSSPMAMAQDAPSGSLEKWDPNYEPPRMPDGTPSFEGVWSKDSLTVLERSPQFDGLVISPAVASAIESGREKAMEASNRPTDPNARPHREISVRMIYFILDISNSNAARSKSIRFVCLSVTFTLLE